MDIIKEDYKFDYVTHFFFPSRTWIKELIYWPTEIAAGIIFLVWLFMVDLKTVTLYDGRDGKVEAKRYVFDNDVFGTGIRFVNTNNTHATFFGIPQPKSFEGMYAVNHQPSSLLNREYAWIALCFMIKHLFYFFDFLLLMKRKCCKPIDLLTPFLNLTLWTFWAAYGWSEKNISVHGGMYLRIKKDAIWAKFGINQSNSESLMNIRNKIIMDTDVYKDNASFTWLWIPTLVIAALNLFLWVLGLVKGRSSAFTGQALSTVLIPVQLVCYHFFLTGDWICSNWTSIYWKTHETMATAKYTRYADYFEARWVFWVPYLASIAGLIFSVVCLLRGVFTLKKNKLTAIINFIYFAFFIVAFVFAQYLDMSLYAYFFNHKTALIILLIILLVLAIILWIVCILEKKKRGEKYYNRHRNWKYGGNEDIDSTVHHHQPTQHQSKPVHQVKEAEKPVQEYIAHQAPVENQTSKANEPKAVESDPIYQKPEEQKLQDPVNNKPVEKETIQQPVYTQQAAPQPVQQIKEAAPAPVSSGPTYIEEQPKQLFTGFVDKNTPPPGRPYIR